MSFKKFTTQYNHVQDRMQIVGETDDADVVSLWLTARLLQRLVPALVRLISSESLAHTREGLLQAWQQSAARVKLDSQARDSGVDKRSTQAVGKHRAWLIHSVDIEATAKQVVMVFRVEHSREVARLPLSALELRQWLGIVYRKCQIAGWSVSGWPAWLVEAEHQDLSRHTVAAKVH